MHNKLRHFISLGAACVLFLIHSQSAMPAAAGSGRWTAIGPDGANVAALIVDPRAPATAFAGTLGSGVLKTTDGGTTRATANGGLPSINVSSLAIDPATTSTVYAGTDAGVFKSIDGGQSWTAANVGLVGAPQVNVFAVAIGSNSSPTVFAGTSSGVFKSTVCAVSWTAGNAGLAGLTARVIAIDPASPSTLYIGVDDGDDCYRCGVFKSTDAGTSWIRIYTPPNFMEGQWVTAIAIDRGSPSRIYVATSGGVVQSTDGGANWTRIASPARNPYSLVVDSDSPGTLYASSHDGQICRTTDSGAHWLRLTNGGPLTPTSIIALAPSATETIYVGGGTGSYRSSEGAKSWTRLTLGVRNIGTYPVTADPASSSTIYSALNGVITKTADGSGHWADVANGPALGWVGFLLFDPASPSTIYVEGQGLGDGSFDDSSASIHKSVDGGAHWAEASNGLPSTSIAALAIAPSLSSTLYVGINFSGVSKSIDGGTSWAKVNIGLNAVGIYVSALAVDPANADIVYVATPPTGRPDTDAKLFKSTNGAAQWRQTRLVVPSGAVITSIPREINSLDSGAFPGWTRTGLQFNAYASPTAVASSVCRFFSTAYAPKSSHFYTPFPHECAIAKTGPHWSLESAAAFYIALPASDGSCAAGFEAGLPTVQRRTRRSAQSSLYDRFDRPRADDCARLDPGGSGYECCANVLADLRCPVWSRNGTTAVW